MKLKNILRRGGGLLALLIAGALLGGCVTTGSQTLGLSDLGGKTYTQSQKAWDTFNYVDTNKRLASAFPTKAERQAQYKNIQDAWNAVKSTYKQNGYTPDFFRTFPQDMKPIMEELAALKNRANTTTGTASADTGQVLLNPKTADTVTIPPYSMVEWTTKGNCMDPSRPAPRSGDKFQIINSGDLVDDDLMPLYQGLLRLANTDADAKRHQQQLVWAFRTISDSNSYSRSLNQDQIAILNKCYPNGAALYNSVVQRKQITNELKNIVRDVVPSINIGGRTINPVDLATAKDPAAAIGGQVQRLIDMPISEPIQNSGFEYNELAEGIYVHAVGTASLTVKMRIINTTGSTVYFNPLLYSAQAQRETQRVSLCPPPANTVKTTDLSGGSKPTTTTAKEDNNFFNKTTNDIIKFPGTIIPKDTYKDYFEEWKSKLNGMNYRPDWLVANEVISFIQASIELQTGKNLLTGVEMHSVDKAILYGTLCAVNAKLTAATQPNGEHYAKIPNTELSALQVQAEEWRKYPTKNELATKLGVPREKLDKAFRYITAIQDYYSLVDNTKKTGVSNALMEQLLQAYDYHLKEILKGNETSLWDDFF